MFISGNGIYLESQGRLQRYMWWVLERGIGLESLDEQLKIHP